MNLLPGDAWRCHVQFHCYTYMGREVTVEVQK